MSEMLGSECGRRRFAAMLEYRESPLNPVREPDEQYRR